MIARRLAALLALIAVGLCALAAGARPLEDCKPLYSDVGLPVHFAKADGAPPTLLCRQGYLLAHNNDTRISDWVLEALTAEQIEGGATRKKSTFKSDPDLPAEHRATLGDYKGSGYDRGHQAPAADFKSGQPMMDESFYLSNMAPQVGVGFNRGVWRQLEEYVRDLLPTRERLIVITGPVYQAPEINVPADKTIGANRVAVPAAFYKIVYPPRSERALSFLLPNRRLKGRQPREFRISVDAIEELTEIDFLAALPRRRQRQLESRVVPMWQH